MQDESKKMDAVKCDAKTEVFSRVVGFYRPVQEWNKGKKEEFKNRKEFKISNPERDC